MAWKLFEQLVLPPRDVRQEGVVAQGFGRARQVIAEAVFEVKTDEVDHALARIVEVGMEMAATKIIGDLDAAALAPSAMDGVH